MMNKQSIQQFNITQYANQVEYELTKLNSIIQQNSVPQFQIHVTKLQQTGINQLKRQLNSIPKKQIDQVSFSQKYNSIENYKGQLKIVHQFNKNLQIRKTQAINPYYLLTLSQIRSQKIIDNQIQEKIKNSFLKSAKIYLQTKSSFNHKNNILKQKQKIKQTQKGNQWLIELSIHSPITGFRQRLIIIPSSFPLSIIRNNLYCLINQLQKSKQHHNYQNNEQFIYMCGKIYYDIDQTFWNKIIIEIGKAGIYRHLGGCDHMIVITKIWKMGIYDEIDGYPKHIFYPKIKRRKCQICKVFFSKFISLNPQIYLCQHCFSQYEKQPSYLQYIHD